VAGKLVTGVAGFVGSHLAEALVERGEDVIGVDSFTDAYDGRLKEENVAGLLSSRRFRLVREDLNSADLPSLLEGVDTVFHLAAQAGVRASWGAEFGCYVERNIVATQRLLEAVKERPIHRFVFASSSSVYGDAPELPVTEDAPVRPVSPYGVTKLAAENLCFLYRKSYSLPLVSLRYFTVYGPRQRPDMALHRIVHAALAGSPLTLFGDGSQSRDFSYVSDVVRANLLAAERDEAGPVYNIGGGARTSLRECISMVEEISGRPVPHERSARAKGDVRDTWSDCSAAKRDLGYAPEVPLREGLKKMVNFYRLRGEKRE